MKMLLECLEKMFSENGQFLCIKNINWCLPVNRVFIDIDIKLITKVTLYIKKMSDFAQINGVYKTLFRFRPPTRVCVAMDFGKEENIYIKLSGVMKSEQDSEEITHPPADLIDILHVQSISYWAPANIGPYSQWCNSQNIIQYAGQIGLIPSTMTLGHHSWIKTNNYENM